jgi:hypothetical protein
LSGSFGGVLTHLFAAAALVQRPAYSGQFKRDIKLAQKRGKDMEKIKEPMRLLI